MNERTKISDFLRDKKYNIVCSYLNNDLSYLTSVIKAIKDDTVEDLITCISSLDLKTDSLLLTDYKEAFLMCCVYSIVSNPFNFHKFLDQTDFNSLLAFCMRNIMKHDIGLLAIKSIVNLDKDHVLIIKRNGIFTIENTILNLETVYAFLVEYSKGKKININFKGIEHSVDFDFDTYKSPSLPLYSKYNFFDINDNHLIQTYKIKILSKQIKYYEIKKEVLDDFMKLLNHQTISIGWNLAKEVVNISKYFAINEIVKLLKENCNEIFANESLWINTLSILGMLALKGVDIGDVNEIIERALLYDNEFVHKSSLLREHCIFLVWSLLKKRLLNTHTDDNLLRYFDMMVFVFILDSSYNVRRASASVIIDFIGIFKFENGYSYIDLVDKNYHKRLCSAKKLVDLLPDFYDMKSFNKQFLKCKLRHYNHEVKKLAAYVIVKHFDPSLFYNYDEMYTLDEKISALYLIIFALEYNNTLLDPNFIKSININDRLYKTRNSEVFISMYLYFLEQLIFYTYKKPLYPIFNLDCENNEKPNVISQHINLILDNMFYLLTKNVFSIETSILCWRLTNERFNKKLLTNLRRNNESFILVNIRQKDLPLDKYKANLYSDNLDIKIATYKAIKYMETPLLFQKEIIKGLNDYTTDRRGDISYKIRLESLYLAISLQLKAEMFIVRYLVDKSKFLREMTVVMLREMGSIEFYEVSLPKKNSLVNFDVSSVNINIELKLFTDVRPLKYSFSDTFNQFIRHFDETFKKQQEMSTNKELCYFDSMIAAFELLSEDYKTEFYIGICSSIIFSDKTLSNFLVENIYDKKEIVFELMEDNKYSHLLEAFDRYNKIQ